MTIYQWVEAAKGTAEYKDRKNLVGLGGGLLGDKYLSSLEVHGNLDLSGCTSLRSLPDGLEVGGYLYLSHSDLQNIPEGLEKVQGVRTINLFHNQLNALPDRLGSLPAGTELIVEENPIPQQEIDRFRRLYPHINLRADNARDFMGVNVHNRNLVNHYQNKFRTLTRLINVNKLQVISINDTKSELLKAAKENNKAQEAIKFMLESVPNRGIIDFDADLTSSDLLCKAWTWIRSHAEQEDLTNGTENLIAHLGAAAGYCNTRHAEEVIQSLEASYGLELTGTASEAREAAKDSDEKITISDHDARDAFFKDSVKLLHELSVSNSPIALQSRFKDQLCAYLKPLHPRVSNLQEASEAFFRYIAEDWDTFEAMALEKSASF